MNKAIAQFILVVGCIFFFGSLVSAKPKKPSGIYGYTLFNDNQPNPEHPAGVTYIIPNCEVIITDARNSKIIKRSRSNSSGKFKITLLPDKYIVYPVHKEYTGSWTTDKTAVTVWQGFYSEADATFNNGW